MVGLGLAFFGLRWRRVKADRGDEGGGEGKGRGGSGRGRRRYWTLTNMTWLGRGVRWCYCSCVIISIIIVIIVIHSWRGVFWFFFLDIYWKPSSSFLTCPIYVTIVAISEATGRKALVLEIKCINTSKLSTRSHLNMCVCVCFSCFYLLPFFPFFFVAVLERRTHLHITEIAWMTR